MLSRDELLDGLLDSLPDDLGTQRFWLRCLKDVDDINLNNSCLNALATADLVEEHCVAEGIVYDLSEKGILHSGLDNGKASYVYVVLTSLEDLDTAVKRSTDIHVNQTNDYKGYMAELLFDIKDGGIKRVSLHGRRNTCIKTGRNITDRKEITFSNPVTEEEFKAYDRGSIYQVVDTETVAELEDLIADAVIKPDRVTDAEDTTGGFVIYLDQLHNLVHFVGFNDITEVIDVCLNHLVLELVIN